LLKLNRQFFGEFLKRSTRSRQAIAEFFHQFARFAARFVAMDLMTLTQNHTEDGATEEPFLTSRPYAAALSWLLRKEESPHIGRNLETHYQWNWGDDTSMMMTLFFTSGASMSGLTTFVESILDLIPQFPRLIDQLTDPSRIVYQAVTDAAYSLSAPEGSHQRVIEAYQEIIVLGYRFFQIMADGLVTIIEKYVTHLPQDVALAHIKGLSYILLNAGQCRPFPAQQLLDDHRRKFPTLPYQYTTSVLSTEWRFQMLKKLIVSGQMQLRVGGVTSMCTDLLSLYSRNRRDDLTKQPVLLYFAKFILDNELVDYIVGTGSHPEIIGESANIVGFLIATKTYTSKETDTIWQTVKTSQDPRVVEAILRMLGHILNLLDYDALLYLCLKADELPLEAFTSTMRDFCERLFNFIISRSNHDQQQYIESPPYELCVRLIREASVPRQDSPLGSLETQMFASQRLSELIHHGPESQVRNKIYVSCIKDISCRTQTASGSICALLTLLRQNLATDLHVLTANHGLTGLIVNELEFTSANERNDSISLTTNSPARQARRDLLLAIILNEPATITDDLGERLWNVLVGPGACSAVDRETAWQMLNNAAKKTSSRNVFIASCFRDRLPLLEAKHFTIGSLDFAREAVSAEHSLSECGAVVANDSHRSTKFH